MGPPGRDFRFPLLLAEFGVLPTDLAREAASAPDPAVRALEELVRQGRVEDALLVLADRDLPPDVAGDVPRWRDLALEYLPFQSRDALSHATPTRRIPGPSVSVSSSVGLSRDSGSATVPTRPPTPSQDLLPARYRWKGVLGEGGMGEVHEVEDLELGRTVALKVANRASEKAALRLVVEARATVRLQHPNILPCYDFGVDRAGRVFYVMKKIEGRTLLTAIGEAREQSLSILPLVRALATSARAVAHAHRQGILHRDIKPANIMLGNHGEVWVVDWGLAKRGNAERGTRNSEGDESERSDDLALTAVGTALGTPGYMAPEQLGLEAGSVGPAADIHGLGASLYQILTGKRPYAGSSTTDVARQMMETTPDRPESSAHPALLAIAIKALQRLAANRYPSADAFAGDLEAYLDGRPVSVHREWAPMRIVRIARAHPVVAGVAAAALVAVLGLALVALARSRLSRADRRARDQAIREERKERLAIAARGLAKAIVEARAAHAERLAALEAHTEPFERMYEGPMTAAQEEALEATLAERFFHPRGDPRVAGPVARWEAAEAQARAHLAIASDPPIQRELRSHDEEWADALARAQERATVEASTLPGFREGGGLLDVGPVPAGTRARLVEYVLAMDPFERRVVIEYLGESAGRFELPIGSYAVEVVRAERVFVFPFLVERGETTALALGLPDRVPDGFVWVPPGEFLAGGAGLGAWPRHRRRLAHGFFFARHEVTFGEYVEFLRAVGPADRALRPLGQPMNSPAFELLDENLSLVSSRLALDQPVFGANRPGAEAYLEWRTSTDRDFEYRLPTDEEWERAATGADGRAYPWGARYDASRAHVGLGDWHGLARVASHPLDVSVFGAFDVAGSLREWTASNHGLRAVARGGAWATEEVDSRLSTRDVARNPTDRWNYLGFRAVAVERVR